MATPSSGSTDRWPVLVVDDDEGVRAMLHDVVADDERFFIAASVGNAAAALDLAERSDPAVVLLDHEMPGMTGLEVLPMLRRTLPDACIVLWSSGGADAVEAAALGATFCLEKSVPIHDVLDLASRDCLARPPISRRA